MMSLYILTELSYFYLSLLNNDKAFININIDKKAETKSLFIIIIILSLL
jgi:hypothetical protein